MQHWGLTDPGCVRSQNQDTFLIEELNKHSLLQIMEGAVTHGNFLIFFHRWWKVVAWKLRIITTFYGL